jgi:hypothetical protein
MGVTILDGPLAGLAAAGTTGLIAVQYAKKLKNSIKRFVTKQSTEEDTDEKV